MLLANSENNIVGDKLGILLPRMFIARNDKIERPYAFDECNVDVLGTTAIGEDRRWSGAAQIFPKIACEIRVEDVLAVLDSPIWPVRFIDQAKGSKPEAGFSRALPL